MNHYKAFNKQWFEKHQIALLWLLNYFITRKLFRYILRISKDDIGHKGVICEIRPNSYTVYKGQSKVGIQLSTDFRTHDKYAKRMYDSFKVLWWLCHFWDWLIADRFIKRWSFGLATLTTYPDAGDPGTTTVDGQVRRSSVDETFSTIRNGAGNNRSLTGSTAGILLSSSSTTDQYNELDRCIFTFDTSTIGNSASVDSATFSLFGAALGSGLGSPDLHCAGATPASNTTLANSDYGQCQTTSFGSIANASFSGSAYNNMALNASGIANINKTGISAFSAQISWDLNNSFGGVWASLQNSGFTVRMADTADTTQDPKLVVNYSVLHNYRFISNRLRPYVFGPGLAR